MIPLVVFIFIGYEVVRSLIEGLVDGIAKERKGEDVLLE